MPDPIVQGDMSPAEAIIRRDTLFALFGNRSLNSTVTETFQSEEAQQGQTDITVGAWTIAPSVLTETSIRSNLKSYYRCAASLASLGSASILVAEIQAQENAFLRSAVLPTTVLPTAISSNWNDLAGGGLSEKVYQRLLELASLTPGWNGEGSVGMNASSLWSFIAFWKQVRQISTDPELVLTPRGHVQAEWSKDYRHHFEIDFRGAAESCYFTLVDGRKTLIEGAAPLQEILAIIKSHKHGTALTWRYDESN